MTTLRVLDLSDNPLISLPGPLPPGLTRLALRCGGLSEAPAAMLLRPLAPTLQDLDISGNYGLGRTGPGRITLTQLSCLTHLTRLALANCGLYVLPAQLTALGASLRALDCSGNFGLGGNHRRREEPPLAPLWALTRLRELSLAGCDLWQLPPHLVAAAGTLARLDLAGCTSLGHWRSDLGNPLGPASVGALVALRHLNLRSCGLWRDLPFDLLQLPRLQVRGAPSTAGLPLPPTTVTAATAGCWDAWPTVGCSRSFEG